MPHPDDQVPTPLPAGSAGGAGRRRPWLRWLAPVGVGALALGGGALAGLPAGAQDALPPRTAAQLLVDVQNADVAGLSGTVVQRADLGLPQLPLPGGQGSSDLTSLISGNHTLRLWYSGPDKVRLALLGTLGESDVILNGTDLWTWSSKDRAATHRVLDRKRGPSARAGASPSATLPALTPQQAADQALAAIDPSTAVSTDGTAAVAGRVAYELVLTPRTTTTLVGQVRIAVDAKEHVPLRVQVFARGDVSPAVSVAFTQVSFTRPDDAQFRFQPPPGTTVTQETMPAGRPSAAPDAAARKAERGPRPVLSGTGWSTVVGLRLPAGGLSALTGAAAPGTSGSSGARNGAGGGLSLERVLSALPATRGSWGSGRLLSSALVSVLITDDGRVYAGAVPAEQLYAAAATPLPASAGAAPSAATAP